MLAEVDYNDPTLGVKVVGYATKKLCNSGCCSKVELFAFLSERANKKKATKLAGFWYVLYRLIIFQNFIFL